ncbi:MAG: inorganic diphosphatase [Erysipelotrichaceae bacterium]
MENIIKRDEIIDCYRNQVVHIKIDRMLGSCHPLYPDLIYPINYGYLPGAFSSDGEELDVYLIGVDQAVNEYLGQVIGVVIRHNDDEDKLVVGPVGSSFSHSFIWDSIYFMEKYFDSELILF